MNFSTAWQLHLAELLNKGRECSPRGKKILELPSMQLTVDMRKPVLTVAERKLSYKFMAAEAYWILTGDDRVETIEPYNPNISQFSDDGVKFFGAYGPPIKDQLGYVVNKLELDRDSRQAGLTIWRQNPPETKDVPCTVAIFFYIRGPELEAHVFMRSSDAWLGVPYDVFNFSMLSHYVCGHLNERGRLETLVMPGQLYLTMGSAHLYEQNFAAAHSAVRAPSTAQRPTPDAMALNSKACLELLEKLRHSAKGDDIRWWC